MPFARFFGNSRKVGSTILVAICAMVCWGMVCWGQEAPSAPLPQSQQKPLPVINYAQPVSHFPNPVGPYTPRHVAAPNLANTARIDSLMHDGKIYLSLNDAIALALENNLDIAIAR